MATKKAAKKVAGKTARSKKVQPVAKVTPGLCGNQLNIGNGILECTRKPGHRGRHTCWYLGAKVSWIHSTERYI